ncbi:MAG TPA: C40 family peptidase [Bacteroidia bacterium]|nr:C40 family peptidase [Bacteroidia bacterium]
MPQQKKEIVNQKKKKKASTSRSDASVNSELSALLGLSAKEIKKSQLYTFINDWYGAPYKYGGCKKSGVDCSCFVNILYDQVYHKSLTGNAADMYKQCEKISLDRAREGDLVFFKINVPYVSHVGVILRQSCFVHASSSKGVMVSRLSEAYFKKYVHSAGRLKDS